MSFWNSPRYYLNCTVQSWSCNRFSLAVCCLLFSYNDFSNGPKSESSQQFGLMSSNPSFPMANSSNKFTFTFHYYLEITLKTCLGILRIEFTILFSRFLPNFCSSRGIWEEHEVFVDVTCVASSIPLIPHIGRKPNLFTPSLSTQQILEKKEHVKPFDILSVPRHLPLPKASEISSKVNGHLFCSLFFCCLGRVFSWSFIGSKGGK